MYLTRVAGIETYRDSCDRAKSTGMYLTLVAGIETKRIIQLHIETLMYLTRVAGIETSKN